MQNDSLRPAVHTKKFFGGNNSRSSRVKRQKGIFYTPYNVTNLLSQWAIQSKTDHVLEPSFGGCNFLISSVERLKQLGASDPQNNIFGCDIDKRAFKILSNTKYKFSEGENFLLKDFLTASSADFFGKKFDVVAGNPPFIALHNLTKKQKRSILQFRELNSLELNQKASLWAYFVYQSLNFLRPNGRIAFILPYGVLQADYSTKIKQHLLSCFKEVTVICLSQKLFLDEGTAEKTVFLLADGYKNGSSGTGEKILKAADLKEASMLLRNLRGQGPCKTIQYSKTDQVILRRMKAFEKIKVALQPSELGYFGKVIIGIVSGDNKFFVLNKSDVKKYQLPKSVQKPVITKFSQLIGIRFNNNDYKKLRASGERCNLLDTAQKKEPKGELLDYLNSYPQKKMASNKTFQKGKRWHSFNDGRIPDAFLAYMSHYGPRLVLNASESTCTNSIHRFFFNKDITPYLRKAISIGIVSTFSQISAEIVGRHYGSGALKLEPSEAKRILIIVPPLIDDKDVHDTYKRIDKLLRGGDSVEAREVADNYLMKYLPKSVNKMYKINLGYLLNLLRESRVGRKVV